MRDRTIDDKKFNFEELFLLIGLFIFPFIFFIPILSNNININMGDGIGYEVNQFFFKNVISEGELPLWNKYVAFGTSFVGDIQNKFFYPFTWICAIFPTKLAFKIFYVLHIAMAEIFMYLFCRQISCNKGVAIFGAFAFSFSNLIIIRYEHMNILCCLIWIPLIFVFLIRYFNDYKKYNLVFAAVIMSVQFMAGFPQTAFYSDLFVFSTLLYLNFRNKRKLNEFMIQAIIIGTAYAGLCMVQVLPLIEIMQFSGRGEISYEYFSDGASNIWQVFDLIAPNVTGDFASLLSGLHEFPTDTYLGVIPLTLIIFAGIYMHKNRDVIFLFLYAIFALVFSCACSNFPILGKGIYMLPVFGSFRVTARMLAFCVIPLMLISILALQYILEKELWRKYLVCSSVVLFLLAIAYVFIQILGNGSRSIVLQYYISNHVGIRSIVLIAVLCVLILIINKTVLKSRFAPLMVLIAVVFQIYDVYFFNIDTSANLWRLQNMIKGRTYEDVFSSDVKEALVKENLNKKTRYFVSFYTWEELADTTWAIRPNGNILSELPMIQSYITFNNPNLLDLMNTSFGMMMNADQLVIAENQSLIDLLNIGYIVVKKNQPPLEKYYGGIIYEEYEGRQLEKNSEFLLGDIEGGSYITISVDVEVGQKGSSVSMYSGNQLLDTIGNFTQETEFYGYSYNIENTISDLKFVVDDGENIKLNGIRFEIYCLKDLEGLDIVYRDSDYTIYKNMDHIEHLLIFENVELVDDAFKYVSDNKSSLQLTKDAYLNKTNSDIKLTGGSGTVNSIEEKNNAVKAEVIIVSEQALVGFSESYYPGWHVYIDGQEAELLEVDGIIQGVLVPNGSHEIIFKYSPQSVKVGAFFSCLTALVIVAYLIVYRRYRVNEYSEEDANFDS